ncbi:MAG: hypothetical protein WBN52_12525, partial [Eudoraea sp.]|uniref:hypothetical protein n=1 Tax=Eudoraea sp. TaxID=1979955 RepID=UPI003C773D96
YRGLSRVLLSLLPTGIRFFLTIRPVTPKVLGILYNLSRKKSCTSIIGKFQVSQQKLTRSIL